MKTKINDLEIIIRARNEAKKAMGEVKSDLGLINKLNVSATRSGKALAAAGVAAYVALAVNGRETALQLETMGGLLGTGTQEAGALFELIRDKNPKADIEALSDGVLTLAERFSEARVESGELYAFSKDFGFEFDASISGAREQTIEFLKALQQLPDPADRVTTAIAVMGDEGARQFNKIVRDSALLGDAIHDLENDVDGLFDADAAQDIDDYAAATLRLGNSFDDLGLAIFSTVDGPLADFLDKGADVLDWLTEMTKRTETLRKTGLSDIELATPGLAAYDYLRLEASEVEKARIELQSELRLLQNIEGGFDGTVDPLSALTDEERAKRSLDEAKARRKARLANEKAKRDAVKAAEKLAADELKIQDDKLKEIEEAETEFLEKRYQEQIAHHELIADTLAFRREQGFVDTPFQSNGDVGTPAPFVTSGGFNEKPIDSSDGAIQANENRLQVIEEEQAQLQAMKDDTLLVADAFGALEGAIAGFADTFLTKGSRAFKSFIRVQQLAATAAAYSAASQTLAGFDSLSAADRIVKGLQVLGIGLGWASQIASLDASAGSAPTADTAATGNTPTIPQAPDVPQAGNTGGTLNVTVTSRTLNDLISVDVVQGIFDLAKDIPGGVSDINFNQVLSG